MNNKDFMDLFSTYVNPDVNNVGVWKHDLNQYWEERQIAKYGKLLAMVKDNGYHVLRNSLGQHEIVGDDGNVI